jgi:small subunit ribosomal protein S3Ae
LIAPNNKLYKPFIFPEDTSNMAKQAAAEKVRKKKWFPVLAPKLFREHVIGEIPLYESDSLANRGLTVNMMNLTGDPKTQHINVKLRVNEVKEGKGFTEILGYEIMPSSVKRLIRRDRTKIDDSVVVVTSDNKKVRIKPLLVTNSIVDSSVSSSIRTRLRNNLSRFVARLTYEKLVEEIITYKLQKFLGNLACKITPIRTSEIRAFQLVEREDVMAYKPTKEEEFKKEAEEAPEEEEKKEKKEGEEVAEEEGEAAEESAENTEDISEEPAEEASEEESQ